MKGKLAGVICILLVAVSGAGYYFFRSAKSPSQSSSVISSSPKQTITPTPTTPSYTHTQKTYYALVTGFKNKIISIASKDLVGKTVYVQAKDKDEIASISALAAATLVTVESNDALTLKLNTDETNVGVQRVDELSFKLKTLEIDNQFLFDKKADLAKYPLVVEKRITTIDKQDDVANYDYAKLTKLGHTGSMIPARGVQYWIEKSWNNDYAHLFDSTRPLFETFDFLSSTWEAPVQGNGKFCDHCLQFVGPDKFMDGVKTSSIDLYSLAANHILDGGTSAIDNTQKKLDELGIKHIGASTVNNDDAGKPVLVEVNGLKIAYLGFNDTPGREEWAMANKPGAASISDWEIDSAGRTTKYEPNVERIKYFLQRAKDLKPDFIFVIMHWGGQEYITKPLSYQKNLAKLLTENGADVILGDHPHWVQEIEFRGDKPVFYCMGNFIFDQMWSTETRQGMSLEMNYVGKKLVNIRLFPHQLYLYDKGMPILLKPDQPEYQEILNRIWSVSDFKKS